MQYRKFFIIVRCKGDLPCILHLACFLFINVKTYWNCPCNPITQPTCIDNALEILLAYESFKGTKDSICNVFNVVSELIAYLQRIHAIHIFPVRKNKSVYELTSVGRRNGSSHSLYHYYYYYYESLFFDGSKWRPHSF